VTFSLFKSVKERKRFKEAHHSRFSRPLLRLEKHRFVLTTAGAGLLNAGQLQAAKDIS